MLEEERLIILPADETPDEAEPQSTGQIPKIDKRIVDKEKSIEAINKRIVDIKCELEKLK